MQIFLLGIALGADAFSTAVAAGMAKVSHGIKIKLAIVFGFFQFLFPLIGVVAGKTLGPRLGQLASFFAIFVLILLAGLMIKRAIKEEIKPLESVTLSVIGFLVLGVSVSIDALAVGFSLGIFSFELVATALVIGVITAVMTFIGAELGLKMGGFIGAKAEIIGGVLLLIVAGSFYFGLLGG